MNLTNGPYGKPPKLWLPRTGQTVSYPAGDSTDRDDGHYRMGNPRLTRFVDNGNGTVNDRATGEMWVKDPTDCGAVFYTGGALVTFNWANAIAACEGLDYGGYTDWRLPNSVELFSLYNVSKATGAAIDAIFTNTFIGTGVFSSQGWYWTSTPLANDPNNFKWAIAFRAGYTVPFATWGPASSWHVRPVRGGRRNAW